MTLSRFVALFSLANLECIALPDRVYFTEYKEGVHKDIFRWDWGIGAGSGAATPATSNGKAHDHC